MYKRSFAVGFAVSALILSGCATRQVVRIQTVPIPRHDNVTFLDKRTSPSVSFLVSDSMYSCHYGIAKLGNGALDPDRMILLHSYLDHNLFNDDKLHKVVVTRFDIYLNRHAIVEESLFGSLWKHGEVIGCTGAQEGEYHTSETPGPYYSAIVIYLNSTIDGRQYNVRIVYPVLQGWAKGHKWSTSLTAAVEKTFATLSDLMGKYLGKVL